MTSQRDFPFQKERVGAHSSLCHANMKRKLSYHFSSTFLSSTGHLPS